MLFSKKDLLKLMLPLVIEQFLAVTVGMADMLMVASVGETAVSGVSLVDTINILLINVLTALATGGAVVCSQYLGRKDKKSGCVAANQLLLSTTVISVFIMIICLLFNKGLLNIIYGNVEPRVMKNAEIYFGISAISYPFLAMYNSVAALYRSMGNSKISMLVSLFINIINIIGNAIFIWGFNMGVAGAATASLISRILAAVIMLIIIRNPKNILHIDKYLRLGFSWSMIKKIFRIGIPNGLENSMFQIGKILVQGLITKLGTTAITANAVAGTLANMAVIPGMAISQGIITVIGQCVGAGDYNQATKYTLKLIKVTYIAMAAVNLFVIFLRSPIINLYQLSPETAKEATQIVLYHGICAIFIWTAAFTLPSVFRAANDVKFTMLVSIFSMWIFRIGLSYILCEKTQIGVLGVWIAMTIDWVVRAIFFVTRFINGKWKRHYS